MGPLAIVVTLLLGFITGSLGFIAFILLHFRRTKPSNVMEYPDLRASYYIPPFRYIYEAVATQSLETEPKVTPLKMLPQEIPWVNCDWLNLLIARVFKDINTDEDFKRHIHRQVNTSIQKLNIPSAVGPIKFHNLQLGEGVIIHKIRGATSVVPESADELILEADVEHIGGLKFTLSTEIYVLSKAFAIPLVLTAYLKSFRGNAYICCPSAKLQRIILTFSDNPTVEFDCRLDLGPRFETLTNRPLVKSLVCAGLKKLVSKLLVYPECIGFYIPLPGVKTDAEATTCIPKIRSKVSKKGREAPFMTDFPDMKLKKILVMRFIDELFNRKAYDVIDELFDNDVTVQGVNPKENVIGKGKLFVSRYLSELHTGFPDLRAFVSDLSVDESGDWVTCTMLMHGHQYGKIWGCVPSGNEVLFRLAMLCRVTSAHTIAAQNFYWDVGSVFQFMPNKNKDKVDI